MKQSDIDRFIQKRMYYSAGHTMDVGVFHAPYISETMKALARLPRPKYNFSRAKWYEVSLMYKSYEPIQERIEWCEQNFGPQPYKPDAWSRWYTNAQCQIYFRDSKDYHWFVLRWGTQ